MIHPFRRKLLAAASACVLAVLPCGMMPAGTAAAADTTRESIEDFSLSEIRMTDAYCTNAFSKGIDYLLSFDTDRLLVGFRENAKLSTGGASRYKGWEDTLIAGHCVGHYLSACAQASANPNLTDAQREELMDKISALVEGMKVCQENSKGKPGFLWAGQVKDTNNVEIQFDNVQQGKTNIINEAWVPWYTMHKLIQGLVDVYNFTGNETAKEIASGLGDWTYNRCSGWNQQTHNTVLSIEYGGMNDCLYELYRITGKDTHAAAAHYFDEDALFERVLRGGSNVLNNLHANTTIPKFIGALKRYIVLDGQTVNGEKIDASRYLEYAKAFFDMVYEHHTYITGGNSEWEHFGLDDILDKERTNCNCETCNSYNMLKLSRELFKITGNRYYMDYYDDTYYNTILSSQNPETGMTTYFQPMATGYFKVYSTPYDSFWCCTGSGMESFTKLGDTAYMHDDANNTLYVNQYQSSVLNWKERGITITQESSIPESDTAVFTIETEEESTSLDIGFRRPWWAMSFEITLNGEECSYYGGSDGSSYAEISREFHSGDKIAVKMGMRVTAHPLYDNPAVWGFKYGPVVLSAELGKENMETSSTGMWVTIPKEPVSPSQNIKLSKEGLSVTSFMNRIEEHFTKDPDALRFTLKDTDHDLVFTPHYLQYQQRYGIYWNFLSNGTVIEEKPPRADFKVTDSVQPGYGQYECDEAHNMIEYNTVSDTYNGSSRYAEAGGYFTYQMAVDPDAAFSVLTLRFENRPQIPYASVRIRVGDTVICDEPYVYSGSDEFFEKNYIIPAEVVANNVRTAKIDGKDTDVIDVTFSGRGNYASTPIWDYVVLSAVKPNYKFDNGIAYFVDCGDQDVTTVSGSDKFGLFNSVTEQLYGPDPVTGMVWGLQDDATDQYDGAKLSGGLYTANTWPDERATDDGAAKTSSFRYTKNQYENDMPRSLDYVFELPNGKYTVECAFSDPWSCSKSPRIYQNLGFDGEALLAENCPTDGTAVKAEIEVTEGAVSLNFRSDDKAINLNYIIIRFADGLNYSNRGMRGDVNLDGKLDAADVTAMQELLFAKKKPTAEQGFAVDTAIDFCLDARDLTALKRRILK